MILLRPSASYIWFNCSAMPRLSLDIPEEPAGDPAREGTCAAWVAECVLTGAATCAADLIGKSHENGWKVDADMADHIQRYVDHLRVRGGSIHAERRMTLNEMIAGTPDAFAVMTGDTLIVDDLKFGYDIVDPYRNTQVSIYAGAIIRMLATTHGAVIRKVVIGIYQPRAFHPDGIYRTWHPTVDELLSFVGEIEARGHDAQDASSRATPGPWCEYCPVAGRCAAVAATTYNAFRRISDDRARQMTASELSTELDFLEKVEKMIKGRINAVRTEATARMKRGEYVKGWGFEEKFGNRKFTVEPEILKALTGVDAFDKPKAISPAEFERRAKAEGKELHDFVERMSTRPRIPPKLVRLDPDHYKKLFNKKDGSQ